MSLMEEYSRLLRKKKIQERLLEIAIDKVFPWASEFSNEETEEEYHPRKLKKEFDQTIIGICEELVN